MLIPPNLAILSEIFQIQFLQVTQKEKPREAAGPDGQELLMVLVGGWPDEAEAQPYSAVSSRPCGLQLPPSLPRDFMWDPVVELVQGVMVLCNIDYDKYMKKATKDFRCWGVEVGREAPLWSPLPSPPKKLFLTASASWEGQLAMVGGSEQHSTDVNQLEGSTHFQLYDPRNMAWRWGPDLPAAIFEGCAVAGKDDGLFVLGYFESGPTNFYLFDGKSGEWQEMPASPHQHTRPGCTMASLQAGEEGLVAISGNHAEYFSFSRREWEELPQPLVSRSPHVRVSVGLSQGQLVVAGGYDRSLGETSHQVEGWQEGEGWVELDYLLAVGRTHQVRH